MPLFLIGWNDDFRFSRLSEPINSVNQTRQTAYKLEKNWTNLDGEDIAYPAIQQSPLGTPLNRGNCPCSSSQGRLLWLPGSFLYHQEPCAELHNLSSWATFFCPKYTACRLVYQETWCGVISAKKCKDSWSYDSTPTSRNSLSNFDDTAIEQSLSRFSTQFRFCSKLIQGSIDLLIDAQWFLAAAFSLLRNPSGLFWLTTGWCGRYHSRC